MNRERWPGWSRRDAGSLSEPQASYEAASPGHRFGPAAQTHDRREAPVASRTGPVTIRP
jgi:hypothetical protein